MTHRRRTSRGPLPQRDGLDAVRCVPTAQESGSTAWDILTSRFPALLSPDAHPLTDRFARGDIVDRAGTPLQPGTVLTRADEVFFHRERTPEHVEPVTIPVVAHDEHLLVVDKPAGLATIPRGEHIRRSALVRLRVAHGLPDLSPIHRLDKQTAGLLAFSTRREERGAYQAMFAEPGRVQKAYRAVCRVGELTEAGRQLLRTGHAEVYAPIRKEHGHLWAEVSDQGRSAWTSVRITGRARSHSADLVRVELVPHTGRTHQLRVHLDHLGLPILHDELYPAPPRHPITGARERAPIPSQPLQLLAERLAFTDPVTGEQRSFRSQLTLSEEEGLPWRS